MKRKLYSSLLRRRSVFDMEMPHRVWDRVARDGEVPLDLYEPSARATIKAEIDKHMPRHCAMCCSPERGRCPVGVVNPSRTFRKTWDALILIMVLFVSFNIPFQVR